MLLKFRQLQLHARNLMPGAVARARRILAAAQCTCILKHGTEERQAPCADWAPATLPSRRFFGWERIEAAVRRKGSAPVERDSMSWVWAQVAHDLRQPLQTARLLAGMLDGVSERAEIGRAARGIGSALDTLQEMLEVLALLARVQAGLQTVPLGSCELADVVVPVVRELTAIADRRRIFLRLRSLQGVVHSNPKLLASAARSIFLNAVRFGDGGDVRVGCRRSRGRLTLEVTFGGTGAGIEKHAFVQLTPARDGLTSPELGLGLVLLQQLCPTFRARLRHMREAPDRQLLALTLPLPDD
jgi:two-component system CheB/CheR fusion protein